MVYHSSLSPGSEGGVYMLDIRGVLHGLISPVIMYVFIHVRFLAG